MAAVVREFKLYGYLQSPTVATVTINGVEVFNGSVEIINPPPVTSPPKVVEMITGEYNGDDTENQTLSVEITVVSGHAAVGEIKVNRDLPPPEDWINDPTLPNSGRNNILINGAPPSWPSDGGPTVPGGTPETPDWRGWAFQLSDGDVLTFDFVATPSAVITPAEYVISNRLN